MGWPVQPSGKLENVGFVLLNSKAHKIKLTGRLQRSCCFNPKFKNHSCACFLACSAGSFLIVTIKRSGLGIYSIIKVSVL